MPISVGALVLRHERGTALTLRLRPASPQKPVEWTVAAEAEWFVKDFGFTNARNLEVSWEPPDALPASNILIGAYSSTLRITQLTPTRAAITTGQTVPVRVQIENQERGPLAEG